MNKHEFNNKLLMLGIFALLVVIIILFSGCSGSYYNTPKTVDYHSGRDGMEMAFLHEELLDELYEDSLFNLNLMVENLGAHDVVAPEFGILSISYDPFYIQASDLKDVNGYFRTKNSVLLKGIMLEGKSRYYPTGADQFISLPAFRVKNISGQRELSSTTLTASLCYPYMTVTSRMVCMDLEAFGESLKKQVCTQADISLSDQGAPVSVTSIQVENQPVSMDAANPTVRPYFTIEIENRGSGIVLSPADDSDTFDKVCSFSELTRTDFNTIQVYAVLSNNKVLDCKPNPVKLFDNRGVTRCTVADKDLVVKTHNYETPLTINLSYVYLTSISKEIEIKRLNPYGGISAGQEDPCAPYGVSDGGKCINKCEYCSKNPSASVCQLALGNTKQVAFQTGFGCMCDKQACDTLYYNEGKAQALCIPGGYFCPGDNYCCLPKCKNTEFMIDGKCYPRCSECDSAATKCACGDGISASSYKLIDKGEFCCKKDASPYSTEAECKEKCVEQKAS